MLEVNDRDERDAGRRKRAAIVAVWLPDVSEVDFEASVRELQRLVHTLGYDPEHVITQRRDALSAAAVIGEGKLKELGDLTGGTGHTGTTAPKRLDKARAKRAQGEEAHVPQKPKDDLEDDAEDVSEDGPKHGIDLIAVDHDISPSQARNLERATGVAVLDRTGVIVEIFHRHAKSREAKLQVEMARLRYVAPRLRESPTGKERQRGRGAGEAALELDRRKIRDRIKELEEELEHVQRKQAQRRELRRDARRVALVGYTNAGKSSLMRALTGSEVLVEDKLFATLDTTVRALQPETKPRILVSDTVGFIKKLPHDLVASFRSTLDEAREASLLLHVVDASDDGFPAQQAVTRGVLEELGVDAPEWLVLNKIDRVDAEERARLGRLYPEARLLSARDARDVAALRDAIAAFFEDAFIEREVRLGYDEQAKVARYHEELRVLGQRYEEDGIYLTVRGDQQTLESLAKG
jgi:GTP-binding protein HflX